MIIFIGNYYILLEIKKKMRSFPSEPSPPKYKPGAQEMTHWKRMKKMADYRKKHKEIIDGYFSFLNPGKL